MGIKNVIKHLHDLNLAGTRRRKRRRKYEKEVSCFCIFQCCFFFIIYTFLHEIGHGLIGVLAGGRIERLVIGFDARITISNASYNTFTLPLMNIMGMLLPYSIFLLISLFYNKNREDILYRVFHGLYIFGLSGSIIPWIFIPLMSFSQLRRQEMM